MKFKKMIFGSLTLASSLILASCGAGGGSSSAGEEVYPNATQEQEEENSETNDEIAIPGFEKHVFEAESLTQDVAFENPEQNDVYFIISLSIEDELVYESQLVEPGKGIYSIELPQTYPAGEYEGTLSYETRSMADTNERKNGASMNTPIVFE